MAEVLGRYDCNEPISKPDDPEPPIPYNQIFRVPDEIKHPDLILDDETEGLPLIYENDPMRLCLPIPAKYSFMLLSF
jgi:hypothetical protein